MAAQRMEAKMATRTRCRLLSIIGGAVLAGLALPVSGAEGSAKDLLKAAGVDAGLCVHLGCGREKTAALTADLAAESHLLVHGLALDAASLQRARKAIDDKGLNGRATVEKVPVNPLPYLPDLANVVVIEDFAALADRGLTMEEVNRVAAPGGAICVLKDGRWTKTVKPRPREMDDWTHPAHGPDASRVSADRAVGFPVGLRWQEGMPMNFNLWAACRAWVIAGGRCFTLSTTEYENLGPASFSKHKMEEYVSARDAFNGLLLWKINCETTNDGKALNYRNTAALVTDGQRVYVYKKDRLVALDAADGRVVRSYPVKYRTVRLLLLDGVLVASGWDGVECRGLWDAWVVKTGAGAVEAFDAASGKAKWSVPSAAQQVLAADGMAVLLLQGEALTVDKVTKDKDQVKTEKVTAAKDQALVAVDLQTGKERWRFAHTALSQTPDLQVTGVGAGVVAVARDKDKAVSILSAADGKPLWEIKPADKPWTPIVDGLLYYRDKKYDPRTGEVKGKLAAGLDSPGCTPSALAGDILTASRGCDYIDMSTADPAKGKGPTRVHFGGARGACLQGSVPANGMFYTAQNFCRCAPGQAQGFIAFGPGSPPPTPGEFETVRPIEKGPAFGAAAGPAPAAGDWPMLLHDASRSGAAAGKLPDKMKVLWQTPVARPADGPLADAWRARLTSCLTAPVAAGDMVFAAAVDGGQVTALDAATGKVAWRASAGGRIDSSPTLHAGLCLFGSHDGWVYALRAKDGELAWRTRAAPAERRMVAFGQVESVWPALGSVAVHDDVVYATAGRTSEADGGVAVLALQPATGRQVWARGIGPGPSRVNDLAVLRDGKIAIHHIEFDPKSGQGDAAAKPKDNSGSLEGLIDGSWTRIGTRRSGEMKIGKATAELFVWSDKTIFGYESRSRTCFALSREATEKAEKLENKDYAWRLALPAGHQVEAMALSDSGLVLAGRVCDEKGGTAGFLWLVGREDSKKLAEWPLDAPPVYHGLAVAGGRLYVSLQNGNVVCFGKAD
jgi:outer membrane protein assembly factor BamB